MSSAPAPAPLEHALEVVPRVAPLDLRDLLRRPLRHELAAPRASFGAEVDDPVGGLDDVEVVLDHDHGVAGVDEAGEDVEELADVVEVEAGGGLVEDVERPAG